jgi:adenosylhomocysteinase
MYLPSGVVTAPVLDGLNDFEPPVMDMSFATQALAVHWVVTNKKALDTSVHQVPKTVEDHIATLKLASMEIKCDRLTPEQKKYLSSWEFGT